MKKSVFLSTVAAISFFAGSVLADGPTAWSNKADIPAVDASVVDQPAGSVEAELVRFYQVEYASEGQISPDGKTVAYLSNASGQPQLWTVPVGGGAAKQLTTGEGVTSVHWAPDSKGLVYFADTDGDELSGIAYISADGKTKRTFKSAGDNYNVFGDFSSDGTKMIFSTTQRNGNDFDLYIQDMKGGEPKEAYRGRFGWFANAWQPDGDYIVVTETRGEDAVDLYLFNAKTKKMISVYNPKVAANFEQFEWRSDGSGFFMATNLGQEYQALAFYEMASGELTRLETPDADIDQVSLGSNDQYIAWTVNEDGYSKLYARDLETNEMIDLPDLPRGVYSIEIAENAPILKLDITGPQIPGDIWTYNFESQKLVRATTSKDAGLDLAKMVSPEAVTFKAQDGVNLYGLFYAPRANAALKNGKPPIVVNVHGGPAAQARPEFDETIQYLAERGYAVLDINVRGSTGFGQTFARLDDQRNRPNSVRDIKDAMAWLESSGRVDTSRAAIMGLSYGGYVVNAVLADYPDLFAAGVSYSGVSDWVRALETASPTLKASDRVEYGDITDPDDRKFLASISPINKASKIKTPILVQHGANDPRDPVTESDDLVTKIRAAGGSADYIRLEDEGHFIQKLSNIVYTQLRVAAFLDKHLMGIEPKAPTKVAAKPEAAAPAAAKGAVAKAAGEGTQPVKAKAPAKEAQAVAAVDDATSAISKAPVTDAGSAVTQPAEAKAPATPTPAPTPKASPAPAAAAVAGTSGALAVVADKVDAPIAQQLDDVQAEAKAKQAAIEEQKKAAEAQKALADAKEKASQAQAAAEKAGAALKSQQAVLARTSKATAEAEKSLNGAEVAIAKAQASAIEAKDAKAKAQAMLEKAEAQIAASAKALTAAQAQKAEAQKTLDAAKLAQTAEQEKLTNLKAAADDAQGALNAAKSALGGSTEPVMVDKGLLEKAGDIVKSVVDKVTGEVSP